MFDSLATALSPPPPATSSDLTGLWSAEELMSAMRLDPSAAFSSEFALHLIASGFPPTTTLPELVSMYLHTFSSLLLPSSPYLCVHYEHQLDAASLGSSLFAYDALSFQLDLQWLLGYWLGDRRSEAVLSHEHWKCQRCEYVVECEKTLWPGRAQKVRERMEEERSAKERADRLRVAREADEAEKERLRRREREQQRAKREAKESDASGEAEDEVMEMSTVEEVEEATAVNGASTAAKVRRGRKRRSIEELTLTPESGKSKGKDESAVKKGDGEVICIDCS